MQKNVLITGVLSEMGAATARAFRSNGFYVYGLDREDDYAYNCDRFFQFDLHRFSTEADYRIRFADIFDQLIPRLDVLICCSAAPSVPPLRDLKLEQWQLLTNRFATGPMLLAKFFQQHLTDSKGKILFLANTYEQLSERRRVGHQLARGQYEGLSNALAADLRGAVEVNFLEPKMLERAGFPGNPRRERAYPDTVARLALFLCSPAAGDLTGLGLRL